MKSTMLINAAHPEEHRMALLEEGVLQELEVEYSGRKQIKGNIYKGVVTRVDPSIHALFVDYGGSKFGFLSFNEVHPSYYGKDNYVEGESIGERPTIEKNIRPGTELVMQVVKEERDGKGAFMTTYISLAGRYLVLMPGSKKGGVSRKIEDEKEREKLKEIISKLGAPEDIALIIRTAGMGRAKADLKKDMSSLLRVWKSIQRKEKSQKAPSMLYQEGGLVIRTIRDYFSSDVETILVDNPDVYREAREFIKIIMPRYQSRVKLHREKTPLFSMYQLEKQIESIYSNRVPLEGGGSIVIDPTEALVSIDVNSGRSRTEKNIEETAFKTNSEAALEIARQLRLRDLAGLVVIDFIDMRQRKHIAQVEKELKAALKRDKARIDVGRISKFGLLEMSRQRIRSSLIERSFVTCPHCGGSGAIKSIESNALYLLRKIHETAMRKDVEKIDILLPTEVANDLLNRKREELFNIEKDHCLKIVITGQPGIPINSFNMEVKKRGEESGQYRPKQPGSAGPAKDKSAKAMKGGRGGMKSRGGGKGPDRQPKEKEYMEKEKSFEETAPEGKKGLLTRIRSVMKG